ncbi:MAG: hypothetical protein Q9191_004464 [Dirinaria sp. TL-2023a]
MLRFDAAGVFLVVSGLLVLAYALTSANNVGWGSAQIIATLVVSVLLLIAFVFHERHTSQALLPPHLADTSYWRFTFPAIILYIAGITTVYVAASFLVLSSAQKSEQGVAAGIFNVALQVGGSVLGLAVLTAVAQGIEKAYGNATSSDEAFSRIAFQSVYYSCVILSGISLLLSIIAIDVPESMRGSYWKKSQASAAQIPSGVGPTNMTEL